MASPFLITASGSVTPATGANYNTASAPANGDTVTYANSQATIDTGLTGLTGVVVANLNVPLTFTGTAGTLTALVTAYFKLGATNAFFGAPGGSTISSTGSGRWAQDFESSAVNGTVYATGSSADGGLEPLRLKCSSASSIWNILGGLVGFATSAPSEASTVGTINASGSATVNCGTALILTNLTLSGNATVNIGGAVTTITSQGGRLFANAGGYILPTVNLAANAWLRNRMPAATITLTSASGVAAAAHTAHGMSTGDYVYISGAVQSAYNGLFQVTVTGSGAYTYAVQGSPTSPATGTITAQPVSCRTLNLYAGSNLDLSEIATDFVVNAVNVYGDAQVTCNAANPNQFRVGLLTRYDGKLTLA